MPRFLARIEYSVWALRKLISQGDRNSCWFVATTSIALDNSLSEPNGLLLLLMQPCLDFQLFAN